MLLTYSIDSWIQIRFQGQTSGIGHQTRRYQKRAHNLMECKGVYEGKTRVGHSKIKQLAYFRHKFKFATIHLIT